MPESSLDHTSEIKEKGRKRKWRTIIKWLFALGFVFISVLVIFAVLLNGTLGRKILKDQALKRVNSAGYSGSFDLSGTLLEGYTISNLNLDGLGIEQLHLNELTVKYDWQELLKDDESKLQKFVKLIKVGDLTTVVDISKIPKSEKKEPKDKSLLEVMAIIRPWVSNPEIQFANFDVTLLKDTEMLVAVKLASFTHAAESDLFKLEKFTAKNSKLETKPQDVSLSWKSDSLRLNQWEVLPKLVIKDSELDWSTPHLIIDSGIIADGAILNAQIDEGIHLELEEGILTTQFINETFGIKNPVDGKIDRISVEILNQKSSFVDWDINTNIHVTEASYGKYTISNSDLTFSQADKNYKIDLKGQLHNNSIDLNLDGQWNTPSGPKQWWKTTEVNYSLNVPKLGEIPELWIKKLDERIDYSQGSLQANGLVSLEEAKLENFTTIAKLKTLKVSEERMPDLFINGQIVDEKIITNLSIGSETTPEAIISGTINLTEKKYEGAVLINTENLSWVNTLLRLSKKEIQVNDTLRVSWSGTGTISTNLDELTALGALEVSELSLKLPNISDIDIKASAGYDYPNYITVESIDVSESDWRANGTLFWDGHFLNIPAFGVSNKERDIVWASGLVPYSLNVKSLEQFVAQEEEINLHVTARPLELSKIQEWTGLKLPDTIIGKAEADISIFGFLNDPQIKGFTKLIEVKGVEPNLNALNARLNFESVENVVKVSTVISEGVDDRITVEGIVPFSPHEWIDDPNAMLEKFKDSSINGNVAVNSFPLARISEFIPDFPPLSGDAEINAAFTGTINNPKFELDLDAEIPSYNLESKTLGKIRDVKIKVAVKEDFIMSTLVTAQIDGGFAEISGLIDINEPKNPIFDLLIDCDHILVFRDDLLSARANTALKLQGGIKDTTISGNIGITESLVFKDLELIPIGVPSSAVADVQLPALSSGSDDLPIPEPFANWKLDVNVKTEDLILIRGNIARGHVEGAVKINGNLKRPSPEGVLYIKDATARLPFSLLSVENGEIIFTSQGGITDPKLKIAGDSSIGGFDINLLVHGDTSSPKTSLTSSPPLPESEIMSLLATGATTDSLENRDAVALKALQIFLLKLQQRQDIPGGNKLFGALTTVIDQLDLQVGQDDEFTGRKFTSASLDLNEHWHLTTQIDEDTRARGLVVYLIRFK